MRSAAVVSVLLVGAVDAGRWQHSRPSMACFAKGFGGAVTKSVNAPVLSSKAKKLLKKHQNNIDAASSDYFRAQMEEIAQQWEADKDMHEARVAATWNTIAMFLPQDYARSKGKIEPVVERRLRHIVHACQRGESFQLLDVGCGDGALVPFLGESCKYSGVDVSSEMIDLGKQRWSKHNFWVGSFPKSVPDNASYDSILFNGSLQFFRDTRQTLADAAALLKPNGRIVLSHVNGAKFVRDECQGNPSVAVRSMPNSVSLQTMAGLLGLKMLNKAELFDSTKWDEKIDGDDEQFYLAVLEKPAQ